MNTNIAVQPMENVLIAFMDISLGKIRNVPRQKIVQNQILVYAKLAQIIFI